MPTRATERPFQALRVRVSFKLDGSPVSIVASRKRPALSHQSSEEVLLSSAMLQLRSRCDVQPRRPQHRAMSILQRRRACLGRQFLALQARRHLATRQLLAWLDHRRSYDTAALVR